MVKRRTGWGSVRGSLNLSTQIQVEYESPGCGGKPRSPSPIPPITLLSWEAKELTPTIDAAAECALVGAKLGMNKHPNPSGPMSNSTKGGKIELLC